LVRISLSDGGDAGVEAAEAGGMRAKLVGLDVVIVESPSSSSRADDGRGDGSLRNGFEVIGIGESRRSPDFGILLLNKIQG
jgi:hypothetical protein